MSKGAADPATADFGLLQKGQVSQQGLVIERISYEKARIQEKVLRRCRLEGLSFKNAELSDCAFFHARFKDCYFKNASLRRVRFIDCFFEHCDFDGTVFSNCGLEYSEFRFCRITHDQIETCLPKNWQNVLFRLARSLRMNAQSMGDYEEYRKFLFLELAASETHFRYMFTKFDGYYKKYRPVDRLRAFQTWARMWIDRLFWGHGEKWTRVLLVAGAVVLVFAFIFRYAGVAIRNMPEGATFWSYLAFSASNFMTLAYQNAAPASRFAQFLVISEAALGLLFFGLLVTSLYVGISKR